MNAARRLVASLFCASLAATATAQTTQEPASAIRLNQLGFQPSGAKRAVIANEAKAPLAWQLIDASGRTVAEGTTRVVSDDRASGEHVHIADFSSFEAAGTGFRLKIGDATSRAFAIAPGLYDKLTADALAYFYHNRANTPIEARFVGEAWARPAGHPADAEVPCFDGTGTRGNKWQGCGYKLDLSGGWYDAGDHGKYVVNGGISVWTLLNLYERQAAKGVTSPFRDGAAAIPEAGNGVNDLLDEVRWQLEFMLRMQVPPGGEAHVPVGIRRTTEAMPMSRIDASGMAHHKMASIRWTALPTAPHLDPEPRVVYPPTTGATLNLAANAAQCARIWRDIDPAFSARCLSAAERAWAAAQRNPEVYAVGDFTGSGGYGDGTLSDEFYWAASELFITTGRDRYRDALIGSPHFGQSPAPDFAWPSTATLGTISLLTVPNGLEDEQLAALRNAIIAAADAYLAETAAEGYAIPYSPERYPWGSNSSVLNRAITLGVANDLNGHPRYRDGVIDAMDYLLGRNPLDQSYVSGYGARPMLNPHHRFWARQNDPSFPPPPPGALSGGPNSAFGDDEVATAIRARGCAPQTCWADDIRTASMNEVAINWNAPLVWVAAFLDEGG